MLVVMEGFLEPLGGARKERMVRMFDGKVMAVKETGNC